MKRTVYLGGYLREDCEFDVRWRQEATVELHQSDCFRVLNPLRDKDEVGSSKGPEAKEKVHRDTQDIERADIVLLVVMPREGDRQSIGTFAELGIAHEAPGQKLIAFVSRDEAILDHFFIQTIATKTFRSPSDAVDFIKAHWSE